MYDPADSLTDKPEKQLTLRELLRQKYQAEKVLKDKPSEKVNKPVKLVKKAEPEVKPEKREKFYQAVGSLFGIVSFDPTREKGKLRVSLLDQQGAEYVLACCDSLRYALLRKKIAAGPQPLWLKVWPKFNTTSNQIYFTVVGFAGTRPDGNDGTGERASIFTLRGNWQFIPQVRGPVISIYRNLREYKAIREKGDIRGTKAAHLPLSWCDAPVKPFKFRKLTKGEKREDSACFVEVEAKLDARRNNFKVVELLSVDKFSPKKVQKTKMASSIKKDLELKQKELSAESEGAASLPAETPETIAVVDVEGGAS